MIEVKIPENYQDRKKLLHEQMALLAEQSKHCEPEIVVEMSKVMISIHDSLKN
jgi:hypothetical protein